MLGFVGAMRFRVVPTFLEVAMPPPHVGEGSMLVEASISLDNEDAGPIDRLAIIFLSSRLSRSRPRPIPVVMFPSNIGRLSSEPLVVPL